MCHPNWDKSYYARQELCAFLSSPSLFIIQDSIREGATMEPFIDITYAAGHRHCRNAMRRYSPKRGPPYIMYVQKGDTDYQGCARHTFMCLSRQTLRQSRGQSTPSLVYKQNVSFLPSTLIDTRFSRPITSLKMASIQAPPRLYLDTAQP